MSQMKLQNVSALVPIETILADPSRVRSQAAEAESFDDHLWRVRAQSEERTAGAQPDSARLSPPQAAPADATGQPTAETEPAADDQGGDPQESAGVDSDENVSGQAPPEDAAENDRTGDGEAETDAEDRQASEAAEAGSQTGQEQKTDTDPDADGAKAADPRKNPAKPLPKQPDGQVDKGNAAQPAADPTSAEQQASSAAQTVPEQTATQDGPALRRVAAEDPAAGTNNAEANTEAPDKTLGQATDATRNRNRVDKRGDGPDGTPAQQQQSQTQVSQAGTSQRAQHRAETESAADEQTSRQAPEPPTRNAAKAAAAADPQADAQAVSNQPATAAGEQTSLAEDQKVNAGEKTAEPAATAAPDSRMNVPLRISPSQEPRAGSTQQPHQDSESGQVDQARFVQRVARAFRAVGERSGSVRLRLSPPQLGSLRLEITVRDGSMTARVEAETPTARNLLLDNLPALRDRLAQQDVKVKQFDVDLMDRSPGGLPDQTADHTQSHRRGGGGDSAAQPSGDTDRDAQPESGPGAANRPGEGTQLNVVI